ncbi:MAG: hypothetical protein JW976_15935 [Syntrophaceae bacterium]|nr:hypothetical protein [Syntrophaceae bacterium]
MYGLIVIGNDPSSYVAAAVASSKGIKTALIAENALESICIMGNLFFNTDTTPFVGLGEKQIVSLLLKDLNVSLESNLLNPVYQIILPENRLDFSKDKEAIIQEHAREFPDLAKEIKSYYDNAEENSEVAEKWLHEHPFIQPKKFKEYIDYINLIPYLIKSKLNNLKLKKLMSRNASFHKVIEVQQALLSFKRNNQCSFFSDFLYCAPLRGFYSFSHGKKAFIDSLINKVETADGLYLKNYEVLSVKKGKVIEVIYMDKEGNASKIEAHNLIVSTKWQNMRLVFEHKKKFSFGDFIRPSKISHYPFTIHLGVNPKCIPEKLARHVLVISDVNKDIYDDNLIILESSESQNEKIDTVSKIPLTATVFLPDNQDIWTRDNLKQTADSIIGRLEYFLTFLKENIEFFDIEESINISRKQRDVVNPKYHLRNAFITGFAAKNNKTRFRNTYLSGASLLVDAGLEGEIISGMNAVARVGVKMK